MTTMAKPGRNDPCPCGSSNKYKKCCLAKEEAVARDRFVEAQARRDERAETRSAETAAAHRLHLREVKAAIAAGLAGVEDADEDDLTIASNAAADRSEPASSTRLNRPPATFWCCFPTCTMATIASAWSTRPVAKTAKLPTAIGR